MRRLIILCALLGCTPPPVPTRAEPVDLLAPATTSVIVPITDTEALALAQTLRARAAAVDLHPPADQMTRALRERVGLLQAAGPSLARLKGSSDPSMVVHGWQLEAALAWDLAAALRDSDAPAMPPDQAAIYREALGEKAGQLEAAAKSSYAECASYAAACRGSAVCALDESAQAAAADCQALR